MDPVGITQLALPQVKSAPVLPAQHVSAAEIIKPAPKSQGDFNAQSAEAERLATIQRLARDVANVYVISDQKFTIFKDMTGQYITRFTSLRDGRVTYIPEPTLFKMASMSGAIVPSMLKIQA